MKSPTFFHLTPITSFIFSLNFILITGADEKFYNYHNDSLENYLFISNIIQGGNFIFYFLLLIIAECGYFKKFLNYLKLKFCLNKNYFIFSQEHLSGEFFIHNNLNNPLLLNPINTQTNKYKEMNEKKNNNIELSFDTNLNAN